MRFRFAEFEIDTEIYELRKSRQALDIEPKVFDLIVHFVQHPDQVLSYDDLMQAVWNGRVVSDATVASCVKNARKALGDSGNRQTLIKTVRGRGFRFTANVSTHESSAKAQSSFFLEKSFEPRIEQPLAEANTQRPQQLSDKTAPTATPSLMILPFRTLSATHEANGFIEGLCTILGTVLTRIPLLRLSAQPFTFFDQPSLQTARKFYEDLGVDYLLSGSVEVGTEQIKINVQLADAKTGFSLWAERFVIAGNLLETLDDCVIAIVAKLEPQLHRAIYEQVRSSDGPANANELFLHASGILALKGWHHDSFPIASELLRQSWDRAPEFACAASYLSLVLALGQRLGLMNDRERVFDEALNAAEQSMHLDNMDSTVLGLAGCAICDLGFPKRALPILQNAVDLNPSNAQAWAALGSVNLSDGKIEQAIKHLRHGIKISPLDSRLSVWGGVLATALRLSGDLDGALEQATLACQRDYRSYMPRVILAAIRKTRNEPEQARQALEEAIRIKPDLSTAQIYYLVGQKLGRQLID